MDGDQTGLPYPDILADHLVFCLFKILNMGWGFIPEWERGHKIRRHRKGEYRQGAVLSNEVRMGNHITGHLSLLITKRIYDRV